MCVCVFLFDISSDIEPGAIL